MLDIFSVALGLIKSLVDFANLKESHKYIDQVEATQLALAAEKNQPANLINDAKIERLEEQLGIELEALKTSVQAGLSIAAVK